MAVRSGPMRTTGPLGPAGGASLRAGAERQAPRASVRRATAHLPRVLWRPPVTLRMLQAAIAPRAARRPLKRTGRALAVIAIGLAVAAVSVRYWRRKDVSRVQRG